MENTPQKNKLKIAKIVFIIIFAIATVGFCLMLTIDAKKGSLLEEISLVLMPVDAIMWIVSFFGFLTCNLLGQIKKTNPALYEKLTRFSNHSDGDTSVSSQSFTQKIASFFKNVWNNPLIMFIITGLLFIGVEIICVALDNQVTYLIVELVCIIIGVCISAFRGWKTLSKILFMYVVWGIATTIVGEIWLIVALLLLGIAAPFVISATNDCTKKTKVIALICTITLIIGVCVITKLTQTGSDKDDGKCGVCEGSGYVPNDGWGLETCPYCKGSGIPPI